MKPKITVVVNSFITLTVFLFVIFTIFNSFPIDSYVPVHKKWFMYGKVIPPDDYNERVIRDIEIDLLAPKENTKSGDFFWLQTSGDLITLTNRNFRAVKGNLSFNLGVDPCGTERSLFIGTQDNAIEVKTIKSEQIRVDFDFEMKSNSSDFFSVVGTPIKPCKIKEEINRNFMAKLTDIQINNLKFND
jgi:hypothetical protein